MAKGAKDVVVAATYDAQDIGLQVGFKILHQALLQMAPNFDVEALDALVNMDVINAAMLKAEAEIRPSWVNVKGKSPIVQVGGAEGTSNATVRVHSYTAEGALVEESIEIAPIGGSVEVAPAEDDAEVAPTEERAS